MTTYKNLRPDYTIFCIESEGKSTIRPTLYDVLYAYLVYDTTRHYANVVLQVIMIFSHLRILLDVMSIALREPLTFVSSDGFVPHFAKKNQQP